MCNACLLEQTREFPIRKILSIWVDFVDIEQFDVLLIHKAGFGLCVETIFPENGGKRPSLNLVIERSKIIKNSANTTDNRTCSMLSTVTMNEQG